MTATIVFIIMQYYGYYSDYVNIDHSKLPLVYIVATAKTSSINYRARICEKVMVAYPRKSPATRMS